MKRESFLGDAFLEFFLPAPLIDFPATAGMVFTERSPLVISSLFNGLPGMDSPPGEISLPFVYPEDPLTWRICGVFASDEKNFLRSEMKKPVRIPVPNKSRMEQNHNNFPVMRMARDGFLL